MRRYVQKLFSLFAIFPVFLMSFTSQAILQPQGLPTPVPQASDPIIIYLPLMFATGATGGSSFNETFDGAPGAPLAFSSANWDIATHSRDRESWDVMDSMQAAHGPDCSAPPATHTVNNYVDAVYQCNNHVMTALNSNSYGVIYLTPDHMVDFSNGTAVIRFDMSTLRTSTRDWVDLWISPLEDNLELPDFAIYPDLSGPPKRGINLQMASANQPNATMFLGTRFDNFVGAEISGWWWIGYENYLTPSATRRDTFELQISKTHIKFGIPAYDFWWIDKDIPALDWSVGVVQFGHHSYTPTKDCTTCSPNTWHWDNIYISPSKAFTIDKVAQRYTDAAKGGQVALNAPAGQNAHLRFAGIGENLQVSFDNGSTWANAALQSQIRYDQDHFRTYWMPIPAGTTTIRFRGDAWWGGPWRAQDISAWW